MRVIFFFKMFKLWSEIQNNNKKKTLRRILLFFNNKRPFLTQFLSDFSLNLIKVLSFISTLFGTVYHVACCRVFWSKTFQTFAWLRLSESVSSSIYQLWSSFFFFKMFKISFNICIIEKTNQNFFLFLR